MSSASNSPPSPPPIWILVTLQIPLKGILKKSQRGVSSRPSTPAPFAKESVTTQSTPEGKTSFQSSPFREQKFRRLKLKTSTFFIYAVAKLNEKILASGDNHRKHYPMHIKVPMKPEAIALAWPLMEPNTTSPRKQRRAKICFDVAFDPRKDNNVMVLEGAYRMDSIPYQTIRLPASTHCTLTEMCIFLDMEEFNHWPINVMRKDGIRCLDVLEAIHKMLQRPLTDGDMRTFGLAAAQRVFTFLPSDAIELSQ
ncbi:hypothetical protein F5877DRAFT_63353 [Lentinula edodes]|nr:hypothetical protein F5877DRAFT_63353 [Lentinula edodes]